MQDTGFVMLAQKAFTDGILSVLFQNQEVYKFVTKLNTIFNIK